LRLEIDNCKVNFATKKIPPLVSLFQKGRNKRGILKARLKPCPTKNQPNIFLWEGNKTEK